MNYSAEIQAQKILDRYNNTIRLIDKRLIDKTGVIFSATSLHYLNNCTIIKLCDSSIPVIVYLPKDKIQQQIIDNKYGCPVIIYLPFVSPRDIKEPIVTSTSKRSTRKFDKGLIHARAFKIRSIKRCPFDQTLYLDNDLTIVNLEKVMSWFKVMSDRKKIISMKNDQYVQKGHDYRLQHNIYERNTGVMYIMCNSNIAVEMLFDWEYTYFHDAAFDHHDQGPMIVTLSRFYQYLGQVLDLPENYNCRYDLYFVKRESCYINHVHKTHYGKRVDPKIVGPRNCTLT